MSRSNKLLGSMPTKNDYILNKKDGHFFKENKMYWSYNKEYESYQFQLYFTDGHFITYGSKTNNPESNFPMFHQVRKGYYFYKDSVLRNEVYYPAGNAHSRYLYSFQKLKKDSMDVIVTTARVPFQHNEKYLPFTFNDSINYTNNYKYKTYYENSENRFIPNSDSIMTLLNEYFNTIPKAEQD
jgi:hypothetical protein